jgi:GMP synthase-like glutamine amidotransferase
MRALLIANASDADPGFVGERLRHHGYAFDECHRESPGEWPALEGHDLVLSLGSDWSVYWNEVAHPVGVEAALITDAHRRGVPVFGICFGSQVTASALGGSVQRGRNHELGWFQVDTVQPDGVPSGPWFQWHGDVVTVPADATVLASNDLCPQAWRVGRAFCTQFHPEVTESMVARWTRSGADEARALGHDPDQILDMTRRLVARSRIDAERLVDWFLGAVTAW